MKLVSFKGKEDPLEISETAAIELEKQLLSQDGETMVKIQGTLFRLSSIKAIRSMQLSASDREQERNELPLTQIQREKRAEMIKKLGDEMRVKGIIE